MRPRWGAIVLTSVWLAGCAGGVPQEPPASGGERWAPKATSPTAGAPSPSTPLSYRILQAARLYRGNPLWLGVLTGGLVLVALGWGAVRVLAIRGSAGHPPRAS